MKIAHTLLSSVAVPTIARAADDTPGNAPALSISEQASAGLQDAGGVRTIKAFMTRMIMPPKSYLMKNFIWKEGDPETPVAGRQIMMGRLFGLCLSYYEKDGSLPDGTPSKSIVLRGDFEATKIDPLEVKDGKYDTTDAKIVERFNMPEAYLPEAYAMKVKAYFDDCKARNIPAGSVEIDLDIGMETTGKMIPYTFIVLSYVEGQASALTRMRDRKAAMAFRQAQMKLNAPETQALLAQADPVQPEMIGGDGPVIDGTTGQVQEPGQGGDQGEPNPGDQAGGTETPPAAPKAGKKGS